MCVLKTVYQTEASALRNIVRHQIVTAHAGDVDGSGSAFGQVYPFFPVHIVDEFRAIHLGGIVQVVVMVEQQVFAEKSECASGGSACKGGVCLHMHHGTPRGFPRIEEPLDGFHLYPVRISLKVRFAGNGVYHVPCSALFLQDAGMRVSSLAVGCQHYAAGESGASSDYDVSFSE